MIKDFRIRKLLQTISLIGIQGDCEYIFTPSCGKLFYGMVIGVIHLVSILYRYYHGRIQGGGAKGTAAPPQNIKRGEEKKG